MAATESLMEGGQATYEKNGEKVNFELQPKNIGLTKEQLESYRNDPFWKPVRTVLFAVFWLSWLLMFAAAIAIVVFSPKCAEKEQPIWYTTQVSYQISLPSFRDSNGDGIGDFNGVTEKLDLLRKVGVTTIHLSPVVEIDKDVLFDASAIIDENKVDERFGTEEELKNLIQVAHDKDMHVIMDLPIATVSKKHPWFANGETEHFVTVTPVNSLYNSEKFYNWAGKNQTKYLGSPDEDHPVLDMFSDNVRTRAVKIIQLYTSMGIDGINVGHVRDVAGIKVFELPDKEALEKGQNVIRTFAGIIRDSKDSTPEIKDKQLFFFASLNSRQSERPPTVERSLYHVVDDSYTKFKSADCEKKNLASCLFGYVNSSLSKVDSYSKYWQFENSESSRLADRFDPESAALMTMLQLCMPGAISLHYGQELGMQSSKVSKQNSAMRWNSDVNSGFSSTAELPKGLDTSKNGSTFDSHYSTESSLLKIVQKLAKLRQRDEIFSLGLGKVEVVDDVLALGRSHQNPNITSHTYLGLFNFGTENAVVKFKDFDVVLPPKEYDDGEIVVATERLSDFRPRQKIDFSSSLTLPAKQGILVKF
ncbi:unnamed protein product [Auanema sp. JU1783]|nr:unnamed protein product [Auanema sp. JU1783]